MEHVPLSEVVQVVVETGSLLSAFLTPQDAGRVDDATIQNRAGQKRCTDKNIAHVDHLVAPVLTRPQTSGSSWMFVNLRTEPVFLLDGRTTAEHAGDSDGPL